MILSLASLLWNEKETPPLHLFLYFYKGMLVPTPFFFFLNQIEALVKCRLLVAQVVVPDSGKGLCAALKDTTSRKRFICLLRS